MRGPIGQRWLRCEGACGGLFLRLVSPNGSTMGLTYLRIALPLAGVPHLGFVPFLLAAQTGTAPSLEGGGRIVEFAWMVQDDLEAA